MNAGEIRNVTFLGGGNIGSSWAVCFAMNGLNVTLYDISDEALDTARKMIERSCDTLLQCGVLSHQQQAVLYERIRYTTDVEESLKHADYIQESVPENYQVKRLTVDNIEKYAPSTAIVGSSASKMRISDICANATHKERYISAHPYNPPHLVPLVELAKGPETSQETEDTVYEFFCSLKKEPIRLQKESYGFIGNRYQAVLDREMADLVGRGVVSYEDANKAITYGPGFRYAVMGPTLIYDLGNIKGTTALLSNVSASGINLLEDVASWTVNPHVKTPDPEKTERLIVNLRHSLLPEEAQTDREAAAIWRDKMLINSLQAHKKL